MKELTLDNVLSETHVDAHENIHNFYQHDDLLRYGSSVRRHVRFRKLVLTS